MILAVYNLPRCIFESLTLEDFIRTVYTCISDYKNINHQIFIEGLLMWNNIPYDFEDNKIIAHFKKDVEITLKETEYGYILNGIRKLQ